MAPISAVPLASKMVALTGLLRVRLKRSVPSAAASSISGTTTVLVDWPGSNSRVPLRASKSLPEVAVPLVVV